MAKRASKKVAAKSSARSAKSAGRSPAKPTAAKSTAAKSSAGKPAGRGGEPSDSQLLGLLARKTAAFTARIEAAADPFDPALEREILAAAAEEASDSDLPAAAVEGVYRELISAARTRVQTVRVAYLGPTFSFTHLAAVERFGSSADLVPVDTISSVFEEVNRGHCDFGVVPIENSTDGRIVDTLDMFTRLPLKICGEVQTRIHHHLLSRSPRGEITEIYSKPQALSQCRDWLARNMPAAVKHSVTSTSTAAQLAHDKPGAAAVASRQAAVKYGLEIVASEIEDAENNVTRFAVIGGQEPAPTKNDRTSLLLEIPHKPGSLSDALAVFKNSKLNLTWIESFPLRGEEAGAYLFFLDVEGHRSEAKVKKVLASLESLAERLHVLGSYPKADPSQH